MSLSYGDMSKTLKTLGATKTVSGSTKGKYTKYDGSILTTVDKMNDYDAYHATKGRVNRTLKK